MDEEASAFKPPYMSFQTFWSFIEELASKPLPPGIDNSLMSTKSGTDRANLAMALTSFGLTDAGGRVQPELVTLVETPPDARKAAFGNLIRRNYIGPLRVSAENGTSADLYKAFDDEYPSIASSDTRRKAVTFFLHASRAAGIELSVHFPETRPGSGAPGAPKKRSASRRKPAGHHEEVALPVKRHATEHEQTVQLDSGGKVTLTYDVNLFEMNESDRAYLLGLVDNLRSYRSVGRADGEGAEGGVS